LNEVKPVFHKLSTPPIPFLADSNIRFFPRKSIEKPRKSEIIERHYPLPKIQKKLDF